MISTLDIQCEHPTFAAFNRHEVHIFYDYQPLLRETMKIAGDTVRRWWMDGTENEEVAEKIAKEVTEGMFGSHRLQDDEIRYVDRWTTRFHSRSAPKLTITFSEERDDRLRLL